MKLVKNSERLQPEGTDLLPYAAYSIKVTPDFCLAELTIYSPLRYPPEQAVLWESYNPVVAGEPYGTVMSVAEAVRGLVTLGLDPKPFLDSAVIIGWRVLTDAVIPGELYDVLIQVPEGKTDEVWVEVHPAYSDVALVGVLRPKARAVTPPPADANWWAVMDGDGIFGRAATLGGALAIYALAAGNVELQDAALEVQHGHHHEFVRLPEDFDREELERELSNDDDDTPSDADRVMPPCPECGSNQNVRVVEADGGFECLACQRPGHESWFWAEDDEDTDDAGADGAEAGEAADPGHVYPDTPIFDVNRAMAAAFPAAEDDE